MIRSTIGLALVMAAVAACGATNSSSAPSPQRTELTLRLTHATPATLSSAIYILETRASHSGISADITPVGTDEIQVKTSAPLNQAQVLFGHNDALHFATAAAGIPPLPPDLQSSCASAQEFLSDQEGLYDPSQLSNPEFYPTGYHWRIDNLLSDGDVTEADAVQSSANQWAVEISFNAQGAAEWEKLTTAAAAAPTDSPQNLLAIFLDGSIISAPAVQGVSSEQTEISGGFTLNQATQLAAEISSGALPPITLVSASVPGSTTTLVVPTPTPASVSTCAPIPTPAPISSPGSPIPTPVS